MIALEALVIVALAAVFLPLLVVPLLFVVAILAALVLSHLFFPTVYILVLEDAASSPRRGARANSCGATSRSGSSSSSRS